MSEKTNSGLIEKLAEKLLMPFTYIGSVTLKACEGLVNINMKADDPATQRNAGLLLVVGGIAIAYLGRSGILETLSNKGRDIIQTIGIVNISELSHTTTNHHYTVAATDEGSEQALLAEQEAIQDIISAAASGNLAQLKSLLRNKDSSFVKKSNGYGMTPIMAAAGAGHAEAVQYLLSLLPEAEWGPHVATEQEFGITALMHACGPKGNLASFQHLYEQVPARERVWHLTTRERIDGQNVAMIAAKNGQLDIVQYILSQPEVRDIGYLSLQDDHKRNLVMLSASTSKSNLATFSWVLSQLPPEDQIKAVTQKDAFGKNVLMLAAGEGKTDIMQHVLTEVLDSNQRATYLSETDAHGLTVFNVASTFAAQCADCGPLAYLEGLSVASAV